MSQNARAVSAERLVPESVNLVTPDRAAGEAPRVELHFFCGHVDGDLFTFCKQFVCTPEFAIQVGEALAAEGRKVSSGLVVPETKVPADLAA